MVEICSSVNPKLSATKFEHVHVLRFFSAIGADFYVIRCVKIYRFMILSGLVAMTDDRNFYSTWRSFQLGDRLFDGFLLF